MSSAHDRHSVDLRHTRWSERELKTCLDHLEFQASLIGYRGQGADPTLNNDSGSDWINGR